MQILPLFCICVVVEPWSPLGQFQKVFTHGGFCAPNLMFLFIRIFKWPYHEPFLSSIISPWCHQSNIPTTKLSLDRFQLSCLFEFPCKKSSGIASLSIYELHDCENKACYSFPYALLFVCMFRC